MQIVSIGDNAHEMSNSVSWENKKKSFKVSYTEIYPEG